MRTITLFLALTTILNIGQSTNLEESILAINQEPIDVDKKLEAFKQTYKEAMFMNFEDSQNFEDFIQILKNHNGEYNLSDLIVDQYNGQKVETVFKTLLEETLQSFKSGVAVSFDEFEKMHAYFLIKESLLNYSEEAEKWKELKGQESETDEVDVEAEDSSSVAKKERPFEKEMKKLVSSVHKNIMIKLSAIFSKFEANNEMTEKQVNKTMGDTLTQNMITDINIEHYENYKNFVKDPRSNIINVIVQLINKGSASYAKEIGPNYAERILYLARSLLKLDQKNPLIPNIKIDNEIEPRTSFEAIKIFIGTLKNFRDNYHEYNPDYMGWNLEITRKLLEMLPIDDAVTIVHDHMTDAVTGLKDGSKYLTFIEENINDEEFLPAEIKNDEDKLKIVDFIGSTPELIINNNQQANLIKNYSVLFNLNPKLYKTNPFTNNVIETFDIIPLNDPLMHELVHKSYARRLRHGIDLSLNKPGEEINNMLEENPNINSYLALKLINLKTNLIDGDEDMDIDFDDSNIDDKDIIKLDDPKLKEFGLPILLTKMFVYEDPEMKLKKTFDPLENIDAIIEGTYNSGVLRRMNDVFNYEEEEEIVIDSPHKETDNQVIQQEEPIIEEDSDIISQNDDSVHQQEESSSDEEEVVEQQPEKFTNPDAVRINNGENIVIELHDSLGEENIDALRKITDFKNYRVEKKIYGYSDDTDVEVTIVYVDTLESECFNDPANLIK